VRPGWVRGDPSEIRVSSGQGNKLTCYLCPIGTPECMQRTYIVNQHGTGNSSRKKLTTLEVHLIAKVHTTLRTTHTQKRHTNTPPAHANTHTRTHRTGSVRGPHAPPATRQARAPCCSRQPKYRALANQLRGTELKDDERDKTLIYTASAPPLDLKLTPRD
jgi:hypothetical protein